MVVPTNAVYVMEATGEGKASRVGNQPVEGDECIHDW